VDRKEVPLTFSLLAMNGDSPPSLERVLASHCTPPGLPIPAPELFLSFPALYTVYVGLFRLFIHIERFSPSPPSFPRLPPPCCLGSLSPTFPFFALFRLMGLFPHLPLKRSPHSPLRRLPLLFLPISLCLIPLRPSPSRPRFIIVLCVVLSRI